MLNTLLEAQVIHLILSKPHEVKAGVPTLRMGKLSPRGLITCSGPAAAEWRRPSSGCVTRCLQVSGSPAPNSPPPLCGPSGRDALPAVDQCVRASSSELCKGEMGNQQGASRAGAGSSGPTPGPLQDMRSELTSTCAAPPQHRVQTMPEPGQDPGSSLMTTACQLPGA